MAFLLTTPKPFQHKTKRPSKMIVTRSYFINVVFIRIILESLETKRLISETCYLPDRGRQG